MDPVVPYPHLAGLLYPTTPSMSEECPEGGLGSSDATSSTDRVATTAFASGPALSPAGFNAQDALEHLRTERYSISASKKGTSAATFIPGEEPCIATANADGSITLTNVRAEVEETLPAFAHDGRISRIQAMPNGNGFLIETTSNISSSQEFIRVYRLRDDGSSGPIGAGHWKQRSTVGNASIAFRFNGQDYYAVRDANQIRCFKASNGKNKWSVALPSDSNITSLSFQEGKLLLGSDDGKIYSTDAQKLLEHPEYDTPTQLIAEESCGITALTSLSKEGLIAFGNTEGGLMIQPAKASADQIRLYAGGPITCLHEISLEGCDEVILTGGADGTLKVLGPEGPESSELTLLQEYKLDAPIRSIESMQGDALRVLVQTDKGTKVLNFSSVSPNAEPLTESSSKLGRAFRLVCIIGGLGAAFAALTGGLFLLKTGRLQRGWRLIRR